MTELTESSYSSAEELLPHLSRLRFQLGPSPEVDPWQHLEAARSLERLPYCLEAISCAFSELFAVQRKIVVRVSKSEKPGTISVLSNRERNSLGRTPDNFLESARRTQDALIPYIGYKLKSSLPRSMKDLTAKLEKNKLILPDEIAMPLLSYWEKSGRSVKTYRDLSQHFAITSSEPRVLVNPEGVVGISFVIANNPDAKSSSNFRFADPEIPVSAFRTHFYSLVALCYEVTWSLIDAQEDRTVIYCMGVLSPLTIGVKSPQYIEPFSVAEIRSEMAELLGGLKNWESRSVATEQASPADLLCGQ